MTHPESLNTFYTQLEYVLSTYQPHHLNLANFNNIVIAGMGGSGIGGKLTKSYFFDKMPIPVETVSDYTLPAYASNKTLLILSSYSGNTEETLSAFEQGKEKGCAMLAITTGGKLLEHVKANHIQYYLVESGFQPRMALGYSFGFLLKIFAELLGENIDDEIKASIENLKDQGEHTSIARQMLEKFRKNPEWKYIFIADSAFEAVAIRACQQMQENSKKEAFVSVLPEANHNMIESYYGTLQSNFIILNSGKHDRVDARFDFVNGLLDKENSRVVHLAVEEFSLKMIFSIIHKLDWFSIYVAEETQQNPMEIENIISLKDFLSNQ